MKYQWYKIKWFDIKRWQLLLKYFKGGKLIDLGCYYSFIPWMAKIKKSEAEIYSIDWVPKKTSFSSDFFDYAVAGQVIEHLKEPEVFVKEVYRILKPGGVFVLSCPYKETEKGEVDINHVWKGITEEDIRDLLKDFKKVKIRIIGSQFFPLYKYNFEHIIAYAWK